MKESFCFDEKQVKMLSNLVKQELVELDVLLEITCLSDNSKLKLKAEQSLFDSILDVLLKRG